MTKALLHSILRSFSSLLFTIVMIQGAFAQVSDVSFMINYDTTYCRYDAYVIVNAGNATGILERALLSSSYGIVVPDGVWLTVTEKYMPLLNNQYYTGTVPTSWNATSICTTPSQGNFDYFQITNPSSPVAFFNNLYEGDTVKLFSFTLSNLTTCDNDVHIFESGVDLPSNITCGGDFSLGFNIGGNQILPDIATGTMAPKPTSNLLNMESSPNIIIDIDALSNCQPNNLTFTWTDPTGNTSYNEDINIPNPQPEDYGTYQVVITDEIGCQGIFTYNVSNDPCSGNDLSSMSWNGSTSSDWFTPDNWTPCGVPNQISQVTIDKSTPNYPILLTPTSIKGLSITGQGYLYLGPQGHLTLVGN